MTSSIIRRCSRRQLTSCGYPGRAPARQGSILRLFRRASGCPAFLLATLLLGLSSAAAADPLALDQHRGKVVLVDFWASWCEPCRLSFPWLNEMQAKYGDRLVVIGVNVDSERRDADRFLTQVPARFQVVYDPNGKIAAQYDVMGMPSSYVFDTSGKLIDTHIGFRKGARAERETQLRELLTSTSAQPSIHE